MIHELCGELPSLPFLYLANDERSTSGLEPRLPRGVPILREPFGADDLRSAVRYLLA